MSGSINLRRTNFSVVAHAMSLHSDINTYNILTSGTLGAGNATLGTIGCNEITIADGHGINLQEDITFTGATTENLIKIPDNLPVALDITEAGNSYLKFVTTNGSEAIVFGYAVGINTIPARMFHVNSGALDVGMRLEGTGTLAKVELKHGGYTAWFGGKAGEIQFTGSAGSSTVGDVIITRVGNLGLGTGSFGVNALKTFAIKTETAPTSSPADASQMYSADIVAGHAAMHIRNENNTIIKLYQQALIADPAGQADDLDSEARAAIDAILDILENNGLMASA